MFKKITDLFAKKQPKAITEEVIITDKKFGEMKFTKTTSTSDPTDIDMECKAVNIPFGKYNPEISIENYDENDNDKYFRGLEFVYDMQDEIINNLYNETMINCDEWNEHDENGNPYTREFIAENFEISDFDIKIKNGEVLIAIWACPAVDELLGDHNINVYINCNTKEIEYTLEG